MHRRLHASPLTAVAADVRCLARREGVRSALRTVARGVTDSVAAPGEMHVLLKDLASIAPAPPADHLRLEDAGAGALAELAALNRARCARRADGRLAANLARGWRGYVAREDGRAVGWYWWLDGGDPAHPHLERLGIELGEGDVYGLDFFLDEAHRGEGRAGEFLYHVESDLRDRGYSRLWGYVDADNLPARWVYGLRGYAVVRTLHLRRGSMRGSRAGSDGRGSERPGPASRRRTQRG